jgi:hypothetical protein
MQWWLGRRELCDGEGVEQGPRELGQVHVKCVWLDGGPVGGCRLVGLGSRETVLGLELHVTTWFMTQWCTLWTCTQHRCTCSVTLQL